MKILLRSKSGSDSVNKTISDIQSIYKSPVIIDFENESDFDKICNKYDLPKDSGRISDEDTAKLYKAKKAIVLTVEGEHIPKYQVST